MNDRTNGIVINQIDYKDNDAIITVYTENFDKVSLYVKGYKKITSKNVFATQLFDESEFLFDYNQQSRFQILKTASLRNEHAAIKSDYDKLAVASVIAESANILLEEGCWLLLKQTYDLLEQTDQIYTVLNLYLAQILKYSGIEPNVDSCSVCDRTDQIETISVAEGGFVCHSCNSQLHHSILDVALLRKFRLINKASYEVFDKLQDLGLNDFHLTEILMQFIETFLDTELKSYKSLKNLNK